MCQIHSSNSISWWTQVTSFNIIWLIHLSILGWLFLRIKEIFVYPKTMKTFSLPRFSTVFHLPFRSIVSWTSFLCILTFHGKIKIHHWRSERASHREDVGNLNNQLRTFIKNRCRTPTSQFKRINSTTNCHNDYSPSQSSLFILLHALPIFLTFPFLPACLWSKLDFTCFLNKYNFKWQSH